MSTDDVEVGDGSEPPRGQMRVLRDVEKAFEGLRLPDEATKALVNFALFQLRVACKDGNVKTQQEWYDKLLKIAGSSGGVSRETRLHRAKALIAYRRNKHHGKGYGAGANGP